MKKNFFWIALIIITIYSITWLAITRITEIQTHKYLDKLKQENVIRDYSGIIKVSGYPFSFNINLIHPRIKLQKSLPSYSTDIDMLFDGVLSMKLGMFSNQITFIPKGDLHCKGFLNKYNFDLTMGDKNSYYQVQLDSSLITSVLKGLVMNLYKQPGDILIHLLKNITIHLEDLRLMNKLTNNLLFYTDESYLKLNIKGKSSNNLSIEYTEEIKDTEFNREFNKLSNAIISLPSMQNILNKIDINIRNYFNIFSPDKFGKINHNIEANVRLHKGNTSIKLDKLSIYDDLHDIYSTGTIKLGASYAADTRFVSRFSNEWYNLTKTYFNSLDTEKLFGISSTSFHISPSIFFNVISGIYSFVKSTLKDQEKGELFVPKLNEMGTIKGEIDVVYKNLPNGFNLKIDEFEIKADDFEVKINGNAHNYNKNKQGDLYKINASLKNYPHIVDSMTDYANKIITSTNYAVIVSGKSLKLSKETKNNIKSILKEASDNPQDKSKDIQLTIVNKDGGECPAIGKYNAKQFCSIWKHFINHLILSKILKQFDPTMLIDSPLGIVTDILALG